jgi:hypothetical protein
MLVSQVMPLVASFQVADGLAGSCGGVLRGQGMRRILFLSRATNSHMGRSATPWRIVQPSCILRACTSDWYHLGIPSAHSSWTRGPVDRCVLETIGVDIV